MNNIVRPIVSLLLASAFVPLGGLHAQTPRPSVVPGGVVAPPPQSVTPQVDSDVVPGRLILQLEEDFPVSISSVVNSRKLFASYDPKLKDFDLFFSQCPVTRVSPVYRTESASGVVNLEAARADMRQFLERAASFNRPTTQRLNPSEVIPGFVHTYALDLVKPFEMDRCRQLAEHLPFTKRVAFDPKLKLSQAQSTPSPIPTPSSEQWGLFSLRAPQAWNVSRGQGVIVAVIDSGVDISHIDLRGAIWRNTREIPNNGIDDDLNGYIDDIHGWNFVGRDGNVQEADGDYHGTHVAGIIAARKNSANGALGVAPESIVMPVRVGDHTGVSSAVGGILYALQNGAQVINNSWGTSRRQATNPELESVLDLCYRAGV